MSTGCWSTESVRLDVGLELLGRGGVVADAVLREPHELAHARRVGHLVAQRAQDADRLALAVVLRTRRPRP